MLSKYIPGSIYFIILLHNEQMDKEGVNPGSGSVNVYWRSTMPEQCGQPVRENLYFKTCSISTKQAESPYTLKYENWWRMLAVGKTETTN